MADGANQLSPGEIERLAVLLEELGEAQQIVGKVLRHGYESVNPHQPTDTNRQRLANELGDVLVAIDFSGRLRRSSAARSRR